MEHNNKEIIKELSNKFIPTVSSEEFHEYQIWECFGLGRKPTWYMKNNKKADEVIFQYEKVQEYYNKIK